MEELLPLGGEGVRIKAQKGLKAHAGVDLTLVELHVSVLTSFILIKLLQNLMKLLPNHIMF